MPELYQIIAYCGYEDGQPWPDGWEVVRWKAKGGYGSQGAGRGRENAEREYIAFSPHCLAPRRAPMLFDPAGHEGRYTALTGALIAD